MTWLNKKIHEGEKRWLNIKWKCTFHAAALSKNVSFYYMRIQTINDSIAAYWVIFRLKNSFPHESGYQQILLKSLEIKSTELIYGNLKQNRQQCTEWMHYSLNIQEGLRRMAYLQKYDTEKKRKSISLNSESF